MGRVINQDENPVDSWFNWSTLHHRLQSLQLVHLDIKPSNLVCFQHGGRLILFTTGWLDNPLTKDCRCNCQCPIRRRQISVEIDRSGTALSFRVSTVVKQTKSTSTEGTWSQKLFGETFHFFTVLFLTGSFSCAGWRIGLASCNIVGLVTHRFLEINILDV